MIVDKISKLIDIMKSEGLDEIEVRKFWSSIRLVKHRAPVMSNQIESASEPAMIEFNSEGSPVEKKKAVVAGISDTAREESEETENITASDVKEEQSLQQIVSPMVGTFYLASGPGADAFVKTGQQVEVGQTVCVIEAMKLMNEIESDKQGIVRKVLVEDSQPVEFGQPLFLVETA